MVACALAIGSAAPAGAVPMPEMPTPLADHFYVSPGNLDSHKPGDILKSRKMPTPLGLIGVQATQLQFRSTDSTGHPIAAVATILVPPNHKPGGPVLSYGAIINSLGLECAPSHTMFDNIPDRDDAVTVGMNLPLQMGWAIVIADHLGPRSAYGAARLGGQITLDSIRAAQGYEPLHLDHSKVGLTGYSGGGMAAAWAAALAPTYAPELPIVGAAIGGVPMNLQTMADVLGRNAHPAFGLAFAAAIGLEREYPDMLPMQAALNAEGRKLRHAINNACTRDLLIMGAGQSAPRLANDFSLFDAPNTHKILAENSLEKYDGKPNVPVFEWHSPTDVLIPVDAINVTMKRWRAQGVSVNQMATPSPDHLSAAVIGMPQAIQFLSQHMG